MSGPGHWHDHTVFDPVTIVPLSTRDSAEFAPSSIDHRREQWDGYCIRGHTLGASTFSMVLARYDMMRRWNRRNYLERY